MKSSLIGQSALTLAVTLSVAASCLAAPPSAPPFPNLPDATFGSVVIDSKDADFPGLYNNLSKFSDRGMDQTFNTTDGGAAYKHTVEDDRWGKIFKGEAEVMGSIVGSILNLDMFNGIAIGANRIRFGTYDNNPAGVGAASFKEKLRIDSTGGLSNPSSEHSGKVMINDVDGVIATGKISADRFGQVYTILTNNAAVPANSLSPVYTQYCNPGDIILSCGASGAAGELAAFDITSLRTYAYGAYCQVQLRNNWGTARSTVTTNVCWNPEG